MNRKNDRANMGAIVLLGQLLILTALSPAVAAPCTPCGDWGAIRLCFGSDPPACCECTKDFETLYYHYITFLESDPTISPNDIRGGEYAAAFVAWNPRPAGQASATSLTWGAIKNLFSRE